MEKQMKGFDLDLFGKLSASKAQLDAGEKGKPYQDVLKAVRKHTLEKKDRGR